MARSTTKVAISIDAEVFERAEALRERSGESRSGLIDRALRALLAEDERRRRIAEYVEGYERVPETADEVAVARADVRRVLANVDWDGDA